MPAACGPSSPATACCTLLAAPEPQVTFNAVDKDYKKKYQPGGRKYVATPSNHFEQATSHGAAA
jgi:hypothetical protein